MGELCLVTEVRTAAEVLCDQARDVAATKLVAKRFPDAVKRNGRWESDSVGLDNADGAKATLCNPVTPRHAMSLGLYVTLRPKGCESVRVYSPTAYHLTAEHVEGAFQGNSRAILKTLVRALRCQEK